MKKLIATFLSAICLIAIATTPTISVNSPTFKTSIAVCSDLTNRGSTTLR